MVQLKNISGHIELFPVPASAPQLVCTDSEMLHIKDPLLLIRKTSPNVIANGLVGTGFSSQYRLQPRVGF